jgi:ParB/RepB/Spo0J family partition protein
MPIVPLDLLDPPEHPMHPPGRVARDCDLTLSIEAMGMLTPILVVVEGNRYRIIDGLRRHEAAQLLGLHDVPVHVADNMPGPHAIVAGVATNLVRAGMPPTQQWRALAALQQAEGITLDQAAAYLGMDPRHARRLAKLGNLHPELLAALAAIEADPGGEQGPPDDRALGTIASAPHDVQLAAFQAQGGADGSIAWDVIAGRCRVRRISAEHAIFDRQTAGVVFDEDLFAQPGSADQYTTTDIDGFIAAQRLALAQLIDTLRPRKRWQAATQEGFRAAIEAGMQPFVTHNARPRLSSDEYCFGYVEEAGWNVGRVRWTVAVPKAGAATPAERADSDDAEEEEYEADEEEEAEPEVPAQPERDIRPLTKAGQTLIAKAKTDALRDALRNQAEMPNWRNLVAQLVLAFHARNVKAECRPRLSTDRDTVLRALIDPSGIMILPDDAALADLATGVLATVLSIDDPATNRDVGSGEIAEWIGAATRAGDHLPRLDTAEVLQETAGAELKSAALAAGLKPAARVADLRRQLAGHAETWRPPGADFGAPGPKPLPASRRRNATDMEDAA